MITKQLANQIIEQTMLRLQRNINVMETNGMILASGDKLRVDRIHEGALIVAETKQTLWITEENKHQFPKTKPGINMPINFQDKLVGVVGITGNPEEIKEVATLVQLTTEMMVHQALIVSERDWKRKMQEMVFEDLMNNHPLQPIIFERLAKLGFSSKGPFYAILIILDPESKFYQNIFQELEYYFEKDSVLIGHHQLHEHFILTSQLDHIALKKKLAILSTKLKKHKEVRIYVGQEVSALENIHYSYQTTKIALQYSNPIKTIAYFDEVELFSLFKKPETSEAMHFSNRILNGLNDKLLHTLQEYLYCNQQLAVCAETLLIHRHTLTYRLNKICEITGYNPSLFQDAIALQIALWMKK
jgi:carbohydrate diacid regulator